MTEELLNATVSIRGVLLTGRGETLVVKRRSDGEWELPGGRLGPDEDIVPGLQRELQEETALEVAVKDTVHANTWRNDDDAGRMAVYYRCQTADRDVELSEEHDAFRWVPYSQAMALLPNAQATAVRNARPEPDTEISVSSVRSVTSD
ncbi:NUDIX hydrolase [Natronomonas salina]|uniref:NUDIX hydrolase n=1 Tax=Natronomonas salina TaxID=1710540 RepID=UPI0015B58B02|nr:NUDIX hydrolase [Natronomonas salina]QLD88749.1 NUDIX hydrolase [Natronomonas salina]